MRFDDLRDAAFRMLRGYPRAFNDLVVPWIVRWAGSEGDEHLTRFIDALDAPHAALASGLVAVERARASKLESARGFLARGEALLGTDRFQRATALVGLVPARMRLGDDIGGQRGLTELLGAVAQPQAPSIAACTEACVFARAGRWDRVAAAPLPGDYHGAKLLVPALLLAFDDDQAAFDRLLDLCLAVTPAMAFDLAPLRVELAHRVRAGVDPARLVALVRRAPARFDDYVLGAWALSELEGRDRAAAIEEAAALAITPEVYPVTIARALALVAEHDPARAAELATRARGPRSVGWLNLAALGRDAEARGALQDRHAQTHYLDDLTHVTADRALALDAARTAARSNDGHLGVHLARLSDLGDRAWVDQFLEAELARLRALPASQRDLPCRKLAYGAGAAGRADLGTLAAKLPAKGLREYAAARLVQGCALVWDFDGALAALDLVPEHVNGRVSAALQSGVRTAEEAFLTGPRRLPLRSIARH